MKYSPHTRKIRLNHVLHLVPHSDAAKLTRRSILELDGTSLRAFPYLTLGQVSQYINITRKFLTSRDATSRPWFPRCLWARRYTPSNGKSDRNDSYITSSPPFSPIHSRDHILSERSLNYRRYSTRPHERVLVSRSSNGRPRRCWVKIIFQGKSRRPRGGDCRRKIRLKRLPRDTAMACRAPRR